MALIYKFNNQKFANFKKLRLLSVEFKK